MLDFAGRSDRSTLGLSLTVGEAFDLRELAATYDCAGLQQLANTAFDDAARLSPLDHLELAANIQDLTMARAAFAQGRNTKEPLPSALLRVIANMKPGLAGSCDEVDVEGSRRGEVCRLLGCRLAE